MAKIVTFAAVAAFGKAYDNFAAKMRDAARELVPALIQPGADMDKLAATAKGDFGYDKADDKKKASWRTFQKDALFVARSWDKVPDDVRKAFAAGKAPLSALAKAIRDGISSTSETETETETETAPVPATAPIPSAVFSPAEMAVYVADWLDKLDPASASPAELEVLANLDTALCSFAERQAALQPVALAA